MFDKDKMVSFVTEILTEARIPVKHAAKFVDASLKRHERFFKLGFDDFGRKIIPTDINEKTLLEDYKWFSQCLEELHIDPTYLKIINKKIWITEGNNGMPLTKAISKKADQLFSPRKKWYKFYDNPERIMNKPEVFLAELGDVCNMGKIAVVSINPGDYIRQSFFPKYTNFSTCHHLKTGCYKHGCVNYSLDNHHIINYIANGNDETQKMLGRVMMVISPDFNMVGQRRFYPSMDIFGETRARICRETVQKALTPGCDWKKSKSAHVDSDGGNGYIDPISIVTYLDRNKIPDEITMCSDVFCFKCGNIHTYPELYCC